MTLQNHFAAQREIRRGVCLLNAGDYTAAAGAFQAAVTLGAATQPLAIYLAACMVAGENPLRAAAQLEDAFSADPDHRATNAIRRAHAQWAGGCREEAISVLRSAIREQSECAELHFQLGTLLAAMERSEEAELRFTAASTMDRQHTDALVSLALCCGARGAPGEALGHLQRAHARRPHDPRLGLLLAQAANAAREQGGLPTVRATMPPAVSEDDRGVVELSRVIESEPEFVDAFLSIPAGEVDEDVFALLLRTLHLALERQPEHAELHYHCGRVLARLGRGGDAIAAAERAVALNPRFTQALIELGRLYQRTDRFADAATRLEQAIAAGAEYADVYFLLGNLYRDQGQTERARSAYAHALSINGGYEAARTALAALPVGARRRN